MMSTWIKLFKDDSTQKLFLTTLFFVSGLYSFFTISLDGKNDSFPAIGFVLFLLICAGLLISKILSEDKSKLFLWSGFYINIGIAAGAWLADPSFIFFWPEDSLVMHVPGAIDISHFFHSGFTELRETSNIYDKIYFTHIVVGFFFYIVSISPYTGLIAMGLTKSLAAFFSYKLGQSLFDSRVGLVAAVIYLFAPTNLFYSVALYKEVFIQFLGVLFLYGVHRLFYEKKMMWGVILVPVSLLIMNERFYLLPMCMAMVGFYLIFIKMKTQYKLIIFSCISLLVFSFLYLYRTEFPVHLIFDDLAKLRSNYLSYTDVAEINRTLPYPLAILKLLFSPYFTFSKFKMFSDFSYILIWGSFFHQWIVFMFLGGIYKSVRFDWKKHFGVVLPFLSLICLFAYIAPYSGRIRNSFYPMLSIYCSAFLINFMIPYVQKKRQV